MTSDWSARFASASDDAMRRDYEGILVPRLFVPWAEVLLDQLALEPGARVLDVACGPGTVARAAARRVGPSGHVTGVDFSPAMLAIAKGKPPVDDGAPIEYLEGPADKLDLPDDAVDVVTCQHGLQFFPDRPAALAEMRRVLRPGGRVGIAVWRSTAECPPFDAIADGIADVLGEPAATTYRSGPWGFADPDELAALLDAAGFTDVRVTRHELPLEFEGGAAQLVETLPVSALAQDVAALDEAGHRRLVDAVARAAAPITSDGIVRSTAAANIATARS
ncbi:MAG TPA: class I SAM-dependent methyltransferase [Jatrophihabitantaceae bacterium]|jgi:SAM-dependent methyltransferase